MKTCIAILRGINVGGQKKIQMEDLRKSFESLGFRKVSTYIQSGNVIFTDAEDHMPGKLEKLISGMIRETWGFDVPVIVRSANEMRETIGSNPFINQPGIDNTKLHVTFLAGAPAPDQLARLEGIEFPPDRFVIAGRDVFLHVPGSYGETKLSNKFFETKLKVVATTRNWATVNKLAGLAED